jgi:hypothetical protein
VAAATAVWHVPVSASAWQVQPRSRSGLGRAPAATRAWSATLRPQSDDRVIFRRHAESSQVIVFWLYEQRVQAGMNINIWDVAEDIEQLVQSARPINVDDLADPDIPPVCSSCQSDSCLASAAKGRALQRSTSFIVPHDGSSTLHRRQSPHLLWQHQNEPVWPVASLRPSHTR